MPHPLQPPTRGRWREFFDLRRAGFRVNLFFALVVLAGLLAGLGSLAYYTATQAAVRWGQALVAGTGPRVVFLAIAGGLVVGLLGLLGPRDRLDGVARVIYGAALGRPLVGLRDALGIFIRSTVTIGTGGSAGREGPVVIIGAGLAGTLGRLMKLSGREMRTLLAAGVAAGVAVAFNAPVAGSLFALEIILGDFAAGTFSLVVLAAVAAAVLAHGVLGGEPVLQVPAYTFHHWAELFLYAGLGLAAGLMGRLYIAAIRGSGRLFQRLPGPSWLRPAVGGLLFGTVGAFLPITLGAEYTPIAVAAQGGLAWQVLLALALVKVATTAITLGSGGAGGAFAPGFVIGAFLGGGYGTLMGQLFPAITGEVGGYALVGLGAMLASFTLAPLTATLLLFELTRDYAVILPTMLACAAAYRVSRAFSPYNLDTLSLYEAGIEWRSGRQIDVLQRVTAAQVMTREVRTVRVDQTVADVVALMREYRYHGIPVVDHQDRLVGMVTLDDVRETPLEGRLQRPVAEVMSSRPIVSFPDETLDQVLATLTGQDVGRVVVVEREDRGRILGIITKGDVLRAYNEEAVRASPGALPLPAD